jgi:antitoxin component of RelBE/YafQ-DinJ toxin-antitoxin module
MMALMQVMYLLPMPETEDKIISLRIFMPEMLRNEFKAVCARQGRNMSEVVTDFVKKYVAEYGTLPYSASRPTEPQPATEPQPTAAKATAAKAKRGKASKGAS